MSLLQKLAFTTFMSIGLVHASSYTLDSSHTDVGFSVKHLMITNVKGNFGEYSAQIDFDKNTNSFKKFNTMVKANSINTGIEKRDNHLRSEDFFFAQEYPLITFNMKSYKAEGDEGEMIGDLTIRGVTREVELEVEDLATIKDFKGNTRVGFTLEGKINRMDYGLKWNKALELGGVAVSEDVKLIIEVQAVESK